MKIGNFDSLLEDHLEDAKIIAIPHHQEEEDLEEGRELLRAAHRLFFDFSRSVGVS